MAQDTGRTLAIVGLVGVGGYLAYEYYQYNNGMNLLSGGNAQAQALLEQQLSFMQFIGLNWGIGATTASSTEMNIYDALLQAIASPSSTATTPANIPGTSFGVPATSQPTSIATTPTSTCGPGQFLVNTMSGEVMCMNASSYTGQAPTSQPIVPLSIQGGPPAPFTVTVPPGTPGSVTVGNTTLPPSRYGIPVIGARASFITTGASPTGTINMTTTGEALRQARPGMPQSSHPHAHQ